MEDGEIEQPVKPVVRFAAPVFAQGGEKKGIVILNYLGRHIIDSLAQTQSHFISETGIVKMQHSGEVALLNGDGYWLYGPDPENLWGFMYDDLQDRTFGNSYPEEWERISSSEESCIDNENGLFTFGTVYPALGRHSSNLESMMRSVGESKSSSSLPPAAHWKVVTRVPGEALQKIELNLLRRMVSMYGILMVLMVIVSWLVARAIVARRLADRAAGESELKFRQLFDGTVDAIFIVEPSTHRFLEVNRAAVERLGYSREELLQMTFDDIDSTDSATDVGDVMRQLQETGQAVFEQAHRRKDGTDIPVEISTQMVSFAEREVFQSVARDITERKKAETALQASEEKFRQIFAHSPAAIILLDGQGTVQDLNGRVFDWLGYRPEEVIGKNFLTLPFIPDESKVRAKDELAERMRGVPATPYELDFISQTGERRIGLLYPVLLTDESGTVTGDLVMITDITERKSAEKIQDVLIRDLTERAKQFRLLHEVGKIGTKISCSLDEMLQEVVDLVPPAWHYPEITCGRITCGEKTIATPNFAVTDWKQSAVIAISGRETGLIEVCYLEAKPDLHEGPFAREERDLIDTLARLLGNIIARKENEETVLAARDAAEATSQSKSDFLASMSHELRTPLNAIIGFSEVLHEQYFGELNEKQTEYVNDVLVSARHLLNLINDILDLSKVEAGKMELEPGPVGLKSLLDSSLIMIKEKAHKHGIKLESAVPEEIAGHIFTADERKLKQVMFNLLSNAAKFTPDGGTIKVEAELSAEAVTVSVTDSGIGLSPEDQDRVFDTFYQAKGGLKSKTPGTGLGLPLSRKFIELHGGRLWAESEGEGKGSRFSFTLPIEKAD